MPLLSQRLAGHLNMCKAKDFTHSIRLQKMHNSLSEP